MGFYLAIYEALNSDGYKFSPSTIPRQSRWLIRALTTYQFSITSRCSPDEAERNPGGSWIPLRSIQATSDQIYSAIRN